MWLTWGARSAFYASERVTTTIEIANITNRYPFEILPGHLRLLMGPSHTQSVKSQSKSITIIFLDFLVQRTESYFQEADSD